MVRRRRKRRRGGRRVYSNRHSRESLSTRFNKPSSPRKGNCMSHHHTYYVTSSYTLHTKEHAQRHLYVTSSYRLRHIIIHTTDKRARAKAPVCHIIIPTTSHHHTHYRQKSTRKGTCMSHHHTYYVTSSYILQTKEHAQRHLYAEASHLCGRNFEVQHHLPRLNDYKKTKKIKISGTLRDSAPAATPHYLQ